MKYSLFVIFLVFTAMQVFSQRPAFEWASQCGNPPNTTDTKTVLASGVDGQFFLAGEFLDTTQFGDKMLISSGGTDIFLVKHTEEGVPVWANKIGAADYDYVQKVITDANGNVIITGYFYGSTQIGADHYTSFGSQDIFIAKYNPEGAFLWSFRAGGQSADYITGLALDADQNIIITGYFYDEMYFGDTTFTASNSSDIYLAKFDAGGELLWTTSAGGSSSDQSRSASSDPEGNILITGSFYYDITFGDTAISTTNPVGVFIAKYLPNGQMEQVFQLDGTYLSTEVYVVAGQEGDFYISGNFSEMIHFGCKTFDAGQFNQDIFIAKYDASGDLQWAHHAYSASSDQVMGIDIDANNDLYLTGHYLDTIYFEPISLPYTLCCGSREIFIVKYSASGDLVWGQQISGTRASVQSMALNSQEELLLSGLFTEEVKLGDLKLSNFERFQNYVTCLQTGVLTTAGQNLEINRLKVFPNPASEQMRILNLEDKVQLNYMIFSGSGNNVISGTIRAGEFIDISFLPAGQYLLRLVDPDENSARSCLFIKQ
jgi:hypothetical protein